MNFLYLLALLFIALKLTDVISWSWWLVLLPLYGGIIILILLIILGLFAFNVSDITIKRKR